MDKQSVSGRKGDLGVSGNVAFRTHQAVVGVSILAERQNVRRDVAVNGEQQLLFRAAQRFRFFILELPPIVLVNSRYNPLITTTVNSIFECLDMQKGIISSSWQHSDDAAKQEATRRQDDPRHWRYTNQTSTRKQEKENGRERRQDKVTSHPRWPPLKSGSGPTLRSVQLKVA